MGGKDIEDDNIPDTTNELESTGSNEFDNLISKYATLDNKNDRLTQKLAKERELERIRQSRELNPNFKTQTILPQSGSSSNISLGDGGASWLRKSFKRAKEQAIERGCSLDQIISERWGSLENFKNLLEEAEKKEDLFIQSKEPQGQRNYSQSYRNPRHQHNSYTAERPKFVRPDFRKFDNHQTPHSYHNIQSKQPSHSNSQQWRKKNEIYSSPIDSHDIHNEIKMEQSINASKEDHSPKPLSAQVASGVDNTTYGSFQTIVNNPDQPLTLYTLNKIGAEHLRCIINGDEVDLEKWATLLDGAREKYLSTVHARGPRNHNNHYNNPRGTQFNKHQGQKEQWKGPPSFPDPGAEFKSMANYERRLTAQDTEATFFKLSSTRYTNAKLDDELNLDEPLMPSSGSREAKRIKVEMDNSIKRGRDHTINNYKNAMSSIENCYLCFDSPQLVKHTIVCYGQKSYLALPAYTPLVPWECYICPMNHITNDHDLDPETTSEIKNFQDALCQMFAAHGMDTVFLYGCFNTKKFFHYKITCVPLLFKTASQVPMYFKKAIMESEYEWSDNKKIIEMPGSDGPRKVVPKGFPYFAFSLGSPSKGKGLRSRHRKSGRFPHSFGKDVIGGIIDVDPILYRKPQNRPFDQLSQAMLNFMESWKPFDFTGK